MKVQSKFISSFTAEKKNSIHFALWFTFSIFPDGTLLSEQGEKCLTFVHFLIGRNVQSKDNSLVQSMLILT